MITHVYIVQHFNVYTCMDSVHLYVSSACHFFFIYASLYCYIQLVDGQCILNVQLHQFQNIYNVEIRPENARGQYCCCDQGDGTCRQNLFATECASDEFCDTYFVITWSDNLNLEPYSTILLSDVLTNTSTSTDVNYNFQFLLSGVPSESVCACV